MESTLWPTHLPQLPHRRQRPPILWVDSNNRARSIEAIAASGVRRAHGQSRGSSVLKVRVRGRPRPHGPGISLAVVGSIGARSADGEALSLLSTTRHVRFPHLRGK